MLALALLLLVYNICADKAAGKAARTALTEVRAAIADKEKAQERAAVQPRRETPDVPEETAAETGGSEYIGCISVPVLELELPVMGELSYPALKTAPCRQCGDVGTGDLVIAGHNYPHHFGKLKYLTAGDVVEFTDMSGNTACYEVAEVSVVEPEAVGEVLSSGFELVLYTCTYGGKARVAVFCGRTDVQTIKNSMS